MGSVLEGFRVFLFIGKINWMLVWITNMILNYMHYDLLLNQEISNANIFSFIFPLILANTLPFVSFFQERYFKLLFYQLTSFDQSLKSFEDLINKILPNQVIIVDENKTKILFCNEEVQKFYNTQNYCEILKKLKTITIADSDIMTILHQIEISNENFEFQNYQTSIQNEEMKKEYFFDLKLGRMHWQNEKAFLILLSDISAIKLVKKLQELDAYKDNLLATVSHDLRTPLNGMVGILELLLEKIVDKELRKYIKIANRCSSLLLFMINDILDFSQINNGKLRLLFSKFRITEMTKEVIDLIKFQCNRKNIDFILDIPNELKEQMIICDYRRLQQVLLNLISNALKFTTTGYIKLSLKKIIEFGTNFIQFRVEDTGIGIKENDQIKLFQLFCKINLDDCNMNKSGVGLGLVISRHLVELLSDDPNAKIEVESKYEFGSKFTFKLPLIDHQEEINEELFEKEQTIGESFKFYKSSITSPNLRKLVDFSAIPSHSSSLISKTFILLVDDDQISLFVLGKYLEAFGLSYETASNGKMAIDLVRMEKKFNLILMDCHMPIMNGFESSKKIKELVKRRIIPDASILALTASTANKDLDECKQSGMEECLTKPVSKKQMKEKLQQILKIRIFEKKSRNSLLEKNDSY